MKMKKKSKKSIQGTLEHYCTYIGGGQFITTTKDGEFLCLKTSNWIMPLHKRLTNYVIEYEED